MSKRKHDPRKTIQCFAQALMGNATPGTPWEHIAKGVELMLADPQWVRAGAETTIACLLDDLKVADGVTPEKAGWNKPFVHDESDKDSHYALGLMALGKMSQRKEDYHEPPARQAPKPYSDDESENERLGRVYFAMMNNLGEMLAGAASRAEKGELGHLPKDDITPLGYYLAHAVHHLREDWAHVPTD